MTKVHGWFIDIIYLLKGREKKCCQLVEKTKEIMVHKEEIDKAFYDAGFPSQKLTPVDSYFTIITPKMSICLV